MDVLSLMRVARTVLRGLRRYKPNMIADAGKQTPDCDFRFTAEGDQTTASHQVAQLAEADLNRNPAKDKGRNALRAPPLWPQAICDAQLSYSAETSLLV